MAERAGVTMCYGSDLLGQLHDRQLHELRLRGTVLPPAQVVRAATCNCERLFCMVVSMHGGAARMHLPLWRAFAHSRLSVRCLTDTCVRRG